jgi:enoyl-CoA hydratase
MAAKYDSVITLFNFSMGGIGLSKLTRLVMDGEKATLTLKRPEVMNAMNEQMIRNINEDLDLIERDRNVRVLLIRGEGKAFCAGADTNVFLNKNDEEGKQFLDSIFNLFKRIEDIEIPVIGVITGYAFGGGAQLSIACDIRIASETSSFRFPGASYGLVVSGYSLPTIVGIPKAKELLFSSKVILAEEALEIGLVNELTAAGEENETAMELAEMICKNPNHVVKKIKKVIDIGVGRTIDERLEIENKANQGLVGTTNFKETFASFSLKRKV